MKLFKSRKNGDSVVYQKQFQLQSLNLSKMPMIKYNYTNQIDFLIHEKTGVTIIYQLYMKL